MNTANSQSKNPNSQFQIQGSILAKNTALNFIGQFIPLLVALFTIPYIIRGLGVERFGIFSLAFVILGYFSIFDLGLGRATTKFVAEALGKGETERIPSIVWTSLSFISILGLIGGVTLFVLTPLLVERILNVPAYLIKETQLVFYICSVSILITLFTATLSGVLEAYQRFDLINAIRIPSNILSSIIPVIALFFDASLPIIVFLLVIKNIIVALVFFLLCMRVMPKAKFIINFRFAPALLNFGGWLTVILITSMVLTYLDRFFIGSRLNISAVGFYTPPFDVVNKLWVLPISMYMTLFPAFSTLWATKKKEDLELIFAKASKHLILFSGVIVLIICIFADKFLLIWLGDEFARNSTKVFQILALGFFLNAQAWIPSTLLQGVGRPDIVAKVFLFELPLYVVALWLLIGRMGIEGAALAWALRGFLELFLFYTISWKIVRYNFSAFIKNGTAQGLITLSGLTLALILVKSELETQWLIQSLFTIILLILFALVVWHFLLDLKEKAAITKLLKIRWKQKSNYESH